MKPQGKLFIISGPSQVGKDTLVNKLKKIKSLNLRGVVTNTTRAKRPGEKTGVGLNFLTDDQFDKMIADNKLLEWAKVRGGRFGTPKKAVIENLKNGYNVLINIDVQGAAKIIKKIPSATLIFITAESRDEIKRRIFASRKMTPDQKKSRWQEAQHELKYMPRYHHIVVNKWGKMKQTIARLNRLINSYLP